MFCVPSLTDGFSDPPTTHPLLFRFKTKIDRDIQQSIPYFSYSIVIKFVALRELKASDPCFVDESLGPSFHNFGSCVPLVPFTGLFDNRCLLHPFAHFLVPFSYFSHLIQLFHLTKNTVLLMYHVHDIQMIRLCNIGHYYI